MKRHLALLPVCLVFAVGCGGSHANSSTDSSSSAGAMATATPAGGSMAGSAMSGGGMSDTTKGESKHHGHSQMAMTGSGPMQFPSESAATEHCPSDTVVWLNLKSKIYHLKGSSEYGTTKHGAYVCEQEANTAGDRAAKSGG